MNSIFSIEDFSDPFWESPPSLNPDSTKVVTAEGEVSESQPEWTFEMFLEEISSSVSSEPLAKTNNKDAIVGVSSAQSLPSVSGQNDFEDDNNNSRLFRRDSEANWDYSTVIVDDSDDYRRVLKNKLETECAALRANKSVKPEELTSSPETQLQPAQSSPLAQGEFGVVTSSSLSPELKKPGVVPMKQVASGSSREDSDDDDLYEENETTGSLNPEDVKKSRRMLSNRESARRSRRRKQEQTSDLETQVNELKGEHSSLLKQLSNMNHKYDDAAVGNRILKADIETLRAKVKMAEETVKRVTGMNPLLLGRSNGHNINNNRMPLTGNHNNNNRMIPTFQPQQNHIVNPNIGIQTVLGNSFVPTTQNHHVVAPRTNPFGWNHETSPHNTVPQNDSIWPKNTRGLMGN